METHPDFYLASSEGYNLETPRKCFRIKSLRDKHRDDLLLVKVDPPIEASFYGPSFKSLDKVILATRHKGFSLTPMDKLPLAVFVVAFLGENPEGVNFVEDDQQKLIAWGEIYENYQSALEKKIDS